MYEDGWPKQLGWLFLHNFVKQMQYIAKNFLFCKLHGKKLTDFTL